MELSTIVKIVKFRRQVVASAQAATVRCLAEEGNRLSLSQSAQSEIGNESKASDALQKDNPGIVHIANWSLAATALMTSLRSQQEVATNEAVKSLLRLAVVRGDLKASEELLVTAIRAKRVEAQNRSQVELNEVFAWRLSTTHENDTNQY